MVRKGGLEPPRSCERQPLKLVRLPIPPLPQAGERGTGPREVSTPLSDGARNADASNQYSKATAITAAGPSPAPRVSGAEDRSCPPLGAGLPLRVGPSNLSPTNHQFYADWYPG